MEWCQCGAVGGIIPTRYIWVPCPAVPSSSCTGGTVIRTRLLRLVLITVPARTGLRGDPYNITIPRLASAASAGASAPCESREVSRGVAFFLGSGGPNCFRFRQILLGRLQRFSSMLGRRLGARRRAARIEVSAGVREEKRRGIASPSSPSWMARRDGPWRV